jgi:hypothetical protein
MKRGRGRPRSESRGAAEGVKAVERYVEARGLSLSTLALQLGMHPSSVTRALGQEVPRWTPSLKKICKAVNENGATRPPNPLAGKAAVRLERLLNSSEPAAGAVLAILDDMQQLVDLISARAGALPAAISSRRPRKKR